MIAGERDNGKEGWEEADFRHPNGVVADYFVVVDTYAYSPFVLAMFLDKEDAEAWVAAEHAANERSPDSDALCVLLARDNGNGQLRLWNSYDPAPEDGP